MQRTITELELNNGTKMIQLIRKKWAIVIRESHVRNSMYESQEMRMFLELNAKIIHC